MYATIRIDLDREQIEELIDELSIFDVINHLGVENVLDSLSSTRSEEAELIDYMKKNYGMVGEDDHQEVLDGIEELKERIKGLKNAGN